MLLWSAGHRSFRTAMHVTQRRSSPPLHCFSAMPPGRDDSTQDLIVNEERSEWRQNLLAGLRTYKELNGDTLLPGSFVIPSGDDRWPKNVWGYKLGEGARLMRYKIQKGHIRGSPTSFFDELEAHGFEQNRYYQRQWEKVIMPALRCYYEIHNNLDVPYKFVVPEGDKTWPEASWGSSLGVTVTTVRLYNTYETQVAASREELEKMDFCFTSIVERNWTEKVLPSLATYRQEFGDCLIGTAFVVPSELPWPKKTWEMKLGRTAHAIRMGISYTKQATRDVEILNSLGFLWDFRAFVWNEHIMPVLKIYEEENGHCRIRTNFVVPSRDPWPKNLWGMEIGQKVRDMRNKGTYLTHFGRDAKRLDALGFSLRFSASVCAKRIAPLLDMYATVAGNRDIPDDFVIPSKALWPEKMWGVHLGLIVARNAHHFC